MKKRNSCVIPDACADYHHFPLCLTSQVCHVFTSREVPVKTMGQFIEEMSKY